MALGEFVEDRVQRHHHYYEVTAGGTGMEQMLPGGSNTIPYTQIVNDYAQSGRSGDTTEVKAVGVNFIIKAKQVALPADLEAQVEEAIGETTNWVNGTHCKARKVNGIVYVVISHVATITLETSATEVAVLPSGFAPSYEVNGAFITDNQRDSALNGRIYPSGSICVWRDTTINNGDAYSATSVLGFISYPLD